MRDSDERTLDEAMATIKPGDGRAGESPNKSEQSVAK